MWETWRKLTPNVRMLLVLFGLTMALLTVISVPGLAQTFGWDAAAAWTGALWTLVGGMAYRNVRLAVRLDDERARRRDEERKS